MTQTELSLFLSGDVMTGRGIDQVQEHSCAPAIYEPAMSSALEYVALAEQVNGPIPRRVPPGYVWGDALAVLDEQAPDLRIINLETSVTTSEDAEPKGINYRMHPANVAVLTAAKIDCAVLANNHVLDWGERGLLETLDVLGAAGVAVAGAGRDLAMARAPAALGASAGQVWVLAVGATDSGIPREWGAAAGGAGVALLPDFSDQSIEAIARGVRAVKRPGDVALVSIHWGGNWGYEIPREHRRFAHGLIERAGVDVVHGHSSHHPKAIELHRGRPIFYGCGDLLNDYEGIGGYEGFRSDLVLLYFPTLDARSGALLHLAMVPMRVRNFRLVRASPAERAWLAERMDRECGRFGHHVVLRGTALEFVP
jgi:poly-gamma-glutamate synthesis protein (capsule biosynthesis protein)